MKGGPNCIKQLREATFTGYWYCQISLPQKTTHALWSYATRMNPTSQFTTTKAILSSGFLAAWKACRKEERRQLLVISVSGAALNVGMGVVIPALPQLSQELGFGATGADECKRSAFALGQRRMVT